MTESTKDLAAARAPGLGCGSPGVPAGCPSHVVEEVYRLLDLGSPKLAFAVASGAPLVPFYIPVAGLFQTVGQTLVPKNGNPSRLVQDTIIEEIELQVQNQNPPSGLDSLTNEFFELQSGIEATVKIVGPGGGYNPVPDQMPLKSIKGYLRRPWLLTYTNGINVDYFATVSPLPFPVKVTLTFKGVTSYWKRLIDISPLECLRGLTDMGYLCDSYQRLLC
jgi:hypothetical protein